MKGRKPISLVAIAMTLFLFSPPAQANMIAPLIGYSYIGMVLALVPIVIVETLVLWFFGGLSFWHSAAIMTTANLTSTVIGIPIASFLLRGLRPDEDTDFGSKIPWPKLPLVAMDMLWDVREDSAAGDFLVHPGNRRLTDWAELAAIVTLLGAYFVASWLSEALVASFMADGVSPDLLSDGVLTANLVSYGILAVLVVGLMLRHIVSNELARRRSPQPEPAVDIEAAARLAPAQQHVASERAKRGIGKLKMAEVGITRKGLVVIHGEVQRFENAANTDKCQGVGREVEAAPAKPAAAGG